MKRKALIAVVAAVLAAAALVFWVARRPSVTIGAVYPTGGGQGRGASRSTGGSPWLRPCRTATVACRGTPSTSTSRPPTLRMLLPEPCRRWMRKGRSHRGKLRQHISFPAAQAASNRGLDFWETGAVGDLGCSPPMCRRRTRLQRVPVPPGRHGAGVLRGGLRLQPSSGRRCPTGRCATRSPT